MVFLAGCCIGGRWSRGRCRRDFHLFRERRCISWRDPRSEKSPNSSHNSFFLDYGGIFRYADTAGVGTDITGDNFEQRCFPGTVLTDNGNAVSHTYVQIDPAEEGPRIIGFGYIRNSNHSGITNAHYTGIDA